MVDRFRRLLVFRDMVESPGPQGLPDIVAPDLVVLFVGFNPGSASARLGHHYAGRNNQFWRLLAAAGLTPRRLTPDEDRLLLDWGLGSTNLVSRPTRSSSDLKTSELRAGMPRLHDLVSATSPRFLAYTGKGVYLAASGLTQADWGRQPESIFEGIPDFVLPSPSGKARLSFEAKLVYYRELADLADEARSSLES